MNRREGVLALLALGIAPLAGHAQAEQHRIPRVGFLISETPADQASLV